MSKHNFFIVEVAPEMRSMSDEIGIQKQLFKMHDMMKNMDSKLNYVYLISVCLTGIIATSCFLVLKKIKKSK